MTITHGETFGAEVSCRDDGGCMWIYVTGFEGTERWGEKLAVDSALLAAAKDPVIVGVHAYRQFENKIRDGTARGERRWRECAPFLERLLVQQSAPRPGTWFPVPESVGLSLKRHDRR